MKELLDLGLIARERRWGTSSMTYIEDIESIPRYKELAASVLASRKKSPNNGQLKNEPYIPEDRLTDEPTMSSDVSRNKEIVEEKQIDKKKQVGALCAPTVPVSDLPQSVFDLEELEELKR